MRLLFGLAFAIVCWAAGNGIRGPLAVYRQSRDRRALAIASAWTALCILSAGTSVWLLVTS